MFFSRKSDPARVDEMERDIERLDRLIQETEAEPVVPPVPPYRPKLNWDRLPDGTLVCNGQRLDFRPVRASSAC